MGEDENRGAYTMVAQENKALVSRIYEAFNTRNIAALDDLLAAGFIDYYNQTMAKPFKEPIRGKL